GIIKHGETTNAIQEARKRKTHWLFADRPAFVRQLLKEVRAHIKRAKRLGMVAAFRLNGTSDLDWFGLAPEVCAEIERAGAKMYDYTKVYNRRKRAGTGYHLTFSLSAGNDAAAADWLRSGGNVAVVFRHKHEIPKAFTIGDVTRRVIDGDESDLRFLDDYNVIVGLYAKGKARKDYS